MRVDNDPGRIRRHGHDPNPSPNHNLNANHIDLDTLNDQCAEVSKASKFSLSIPNSVDC